MTPVCSAVDRVFVLVVDWIPLDFDNRVSPCSDIVVGYFFFFLVQRMSAMMMVVVIVVVMFDIVLPMVIVIEGAIVSNAGDGW